MGKGIERFTVIAVDRLRKVGLHADGGGLYLQVSKTKDGEGLSKSWIFRFATAEGKERKMGLGSLDTVSLADAREEAARCRRQRKDGADPIAARDEARRKATVAAVKNITFAKAAEKYIAAHEAGWRHAKSSEQWTNSIATHVNPVIGHLQVRDIDAGLVLRCLEPIWRTTTETASRLRGRIERILGWAKVHGYREGENPAAWTDNLDQLLARPGKVTKKKQHPALPYDDMPEFMAQLRGQDGVAARALEFAILTAARSGEVRGLPWAGEVDQAARVWTVPAERMKREREHRVPLAAAAAAIIEGMRDLRQNDYVFPGERADALTEAALSRVIQDMSDAREKAGLPRWVDPKQGNRDVVPHGFRSTFDDWTIETTTFPDWLSSAALAHAKGDKVEESYKRGDAIAKRRELMDAWATYCAAPAGGNVVSLRQVG
jgi:integrase